MAEHLKIAEYENLGLATVMLRKGATSSAIEAALNTRVPRGPRCEDSDTLRLIGTGPGMWLAFADAPSSQWAEELSQRLSGVASVSDQSGSYVVFAMSGLSARSILQKGAFIDLDALTFREGSAATTVIAHIGAIVWLSNDTFHVAIFRSLAESFREWLQSATR